MGGNHLNLIDQTRNLVEKYLGDKYLISAIMGLEIISKVSL
jgi:hypothetical protein